MMTKMTIRELFGRLDEIGWSYFVYRAPGPLTLDSQCLVHDPDDVPHGGELPEAASHLGYVEVIGIDDLCSIRENARMQGRVPADDELLEALIYYLVNDAYMRFDGV